MVYFEIEEMKKLVQALNEASAAYYNSGSSYMSDHEWDAMFDKLKKMEEKSGVVLSGSPTHSVGAPIKVNDLETVVHEYPALSLDKTKDIDAFPDIFSNSAAGMAVVMWKLDGSTVVLTYDGGKLTLAATRGNGEIGQNITHNASYICGIPQEIPYKGHLVLRGEAVMSREEFDRINDSLPEGTEPYANPRNLANATITMKDSGEMRKRKIQFFAFNLVHIDDLSEMEADTFMNRLNLLEKFGFDTVYRLYGDARCDLIAVMEGFSEQVVNFPYPVDGLVVASDDVAYASTLPVTGHHPDPLVGYAFKWADEIAETTLRNIEWGVGRTGVITPVAVFDPVELEGTTVSRASVHNVSILKRLKLRRGDKIGVFKANKIVPQIANNFTAEHDDTPALKYNESHAMYCPCCGKETDSRISEDGTVEIEVCTNPDCAAKHVKKFVHFAERDCMNIKGLSEATLGKFISNGFLKDLADIYTLNRYEKRIVVMEGFGQKSYDNLMETIEASKKTSFVPFIHALGIPNIGKGQAKLFDKEYNGDVMAFFKDVHDRHNFTHIDGIGEVLQDSLWRWGNEYLCFIPFMDDFQKESYETVLKANLEVFYLLQILNIQKPEKKQGNMPLVGKIFVITGKLEHFANREELVKKIEDLGGKASGSVSKNTSYLINNDADSLSGKNKKAKELGVRIISEEEFLNMSENTK